MPLGRFVEGVGRRAINTVGPTLWDYVRIGGSGLAVLFAIDTIVAGVESTHIGFSENYIPNDFKFSGFSGHFAEHQVFNAFHEPHGTDEWLKTFGLIALAGIPTADFLWQKNSGGGHDAHGHDDHAHGH